MPEWLISLLRNNGIKAGPDAMDRYTKRPMYIEDSLLYGPNGEEAYGKFNHRTKDIEISKQSTHFNDTMQHEILHSIFDKTNNTGITGNSTFIQDIQNQAPTMDTFNMPGSDYEHLLISVLQNSLPYRITEKGDVATYLSQEVVDDGDVVKALLQPKATPSRSDIQTVQLLRKLLGQ